jgi:hypothetical protein
VGVDKAAGRDPMFGVCRENSLAERTHATAVETDIPPAKVFQFHFHFQLQNHQTTTNVDAVFFIVSASAGSIL